MFTAPPDLSDVAVTASVAREWGISASAVAYMPVGFGSHHWEVLDRGATRWFVTAHDLAAPGWVSRERLRAALATARAVRDAGATFVVAPLVSATGDVVTMVDDRFAISVYPWVDGVSHRHGSYDDREVRDEVLDIVAALHRFDIEAPAFTETFAIPARDALNADAAWTGQGPYRERARSALSASGVAVASLLDRYDDLAADVAARSERFVLTHGEPHIANTMRTEDGWVLIDWDTALMAPPERDLWMLDMGDGLLGGAYEARTGAAVDLRALELYRHWWTLAEIAGYVALFQADHEDSADSAESWTNLTHYLEVAVRETT